MTALLVDVAGWTGAGALLIAYALVSSGRRDGRSLAFQILNLVGATGLLANGVWHGAWPSAALNGVWLLIGAHALTRLSVRGVATATGSRDRAEVARPGHLTGDLTGAERPPAARR